MSDRMPGQRFADQPKTPSDAIPQETPWQVAPPPVPTTPQRYRSNAPVIGVVAGALVIVVAALLLFWGLRPQTGSTPAQTPTTPVLPTGYTPSPNWQGIEFTSDDYGAAGYWQVGPPDWGYDSVTITTTLTVETGTMRFTFFALDNQASNDYFETSGGTLEFGSVGPGQSQTGTVILNIPRGDFTLYLATARGYQVAALLISG